MDFGSLLIISNYIKVDSISKSRQIWWKLRPHMDFGTIEFRMLDAQRSLSKTRMFIALAQALVFQATEDYNNNSIKEFFSSEFLADSLWKASRFDFTSKLIDVETEQVITMENKIMQMLEYAMPALKIFGNTHILAEVNDIINNGPECERQISSFNIDGMDGLKQYLMDHVEYNIV